MPRSGRSVKPWVMPMTPASPRNSAHSDQPNAASVPTEMSVSIVAAPWRRLAQAARWNGQAPHTTTGAASVRDIHCQASNCRAGIIAIRTTGTVRAALISTRSRKARVGSSGSTGSRSPPVDAGRR